MGKSRKKPRSAAPKLQAFTVDLPRPFYQDIEAVHQQDTRVIWGKDREDALKRSKLLSYRSLITFVNEFER